VLRGTVVLAGDPIINYNLYIYHTNNNIPTQYLGEKPCTGFKVHAQNFDISDNFVEKNKSTSLSDSNEMPFKTVLYDNYFPE